MLINAGIARKKILIQRWMTAVTEMQIKGNCIFMKQW